MDASAGEFAIRVSDLVVGFGRRIVIDHLSLDVRRGEILGLVGASGGGKSVLMRTIIGLIPRRSGEIEVMGATIGSTHDRGTQMAAGKWGILFQQGALFSSLTARQNIQFPLRENLTVGRAAGGDRDCQAGDGRSDPGRRRQVSLRTVGRHDQARGTGAGAGA